MTIFYNLAPCQGADCYRNLEVGDQIDGMSIRSKFNGKKDGDVYDSLFLSGPTIFKGDRGYDKLALYIKVYDDKNRLLAAEAPEKKAFRIDLEPGRYDIEVSLCKKRPKGETCFGADPGYLNFSVTIQSNPVSLTLKEQITARDQSPEIANGFSDMILNTGFDEYKIRIDAAEPDADQLTIRAMTELGDRNVKLALKGNILSILLDRPASNTISKITAQAVAKGKIVTKTFRILFSAAVVAFGKDFDVSGKFASQASRNRHKVILEGSCAIRGDNGYRNQAFYMNITDSKVRKRFRKPVDYTIRDNFKRGVYYIESMLKFTKVTKTKKGRKTSTRSFQYTKDLGDTYHINVSCPEFNSSLALLEKDNRDVPPSIVTNLPDLILAVDFSAVHIPLKNMDINGDKVDLSVRGDKRGVRPVITDQRLSLFPDSPKKSTRVNATVTASANNQHTSKSFTIFLNDRKIAVGEQFEVTGKIKGQKDLQMLAVILSGQYRIEGNNGFSNQAFYTSVTQKEAVTVFSPTDKAITRAFPNGIYQLTASLNNGKGRYYRYKPGKGDQYKIVVKCPKINTSTEALGRLLGF